MCLEFVQGLVNNLFNFFGIGGDFFDNVDHGGGAGFDVFFGVDDRIDNVVDL